MMKFTPVYIESVHGLLNSPKFYPNFSGKELLFKFNIIHYVYLYFIYAYIYIKLGNFSLHHTI